MSLSRRKIKNSALACLSLALCATLTAGTVLANFDGKISSGQSASDSLPFTDVTREFDTANLTTQNFNSSVLSNTKANYETKSVIVTLESESILEAKGADQTVAEYTETSVGFRKLRAIDAEQKNFLNRLTARRIDYKLKSAYSSITNAVVIETDTSHVSEIKAMSGVKSVVIGRTYLVPETFSATMENGAVANDSFVYQTGIYDSSAYSDLTKYSWGTGAGTVVAVVDTGLDYSHEAFQNMPPADTARFKKSDIAGRLQNTTAAKRVAAVGGSLTADDVYINEKVPFAFDYADTDTEVYPSYSNHGTHVAGIIGGRADSYSDKDGNVPKDDHGDPIPFVGVAPDCQLVICKTFTDNLDDPALGGAEAEAIMGALEDCVNIGVDVINMSLGTTAGFTSTDDGDDEGEIFDTIFSNIQKAGISLICAASNDYSSGFGSVYGTNLASNPDSATVGSPSSYFAAMSVASVSGQKSEYMLNSEGKSVFFENASDGNAVQYDFIDLMLTDKDENGEVIKTYDEKSYEYVVVGTGQSTNYYGNIRNLVRGRVALIQRGSNTFQQKVELAKRNGAIAVIVYNNVPGTIRMTLGDLAEADFIPAVSITMDAGKKLVDLAKNGQSGIVGTITVSRNLSAGPFMSAFSSWGPTPDLKLKPEITAHGGEITSTVPGGYAEQSGTSMASPNMAGLTALVRNYVKTLDIAAGYEQEPSKIIQLTNQLIMSTATTAFDEEAHAYSPRKQGAGLANLDNIISTRAYISTQEGDAHYYAEKDGRPKIEFGDDKEETGEYTFNFHVNNFGDKELKFKPEAMFMTETLASDGIAVAEQSYPLGDTGTFKINGTIVEEIAISAGESVNVTVTLKLSDAEKKYIKDSFKNGMYVEGFIKLVAVNADGLPADQLQCDLTLPFIGFFGDWKKAPMLDMDAYELAQIKQDSSIDEEDKPSETIWATQPYASYWNEDFVIPLGSYVYTQDPDPSKTEIYANMEYNSLSRFNEYYNEDGIGNYLTTYNIRCVYAGLLRNARRVNYKLYDEATGELLMEDHVNRVSKAYANGGTARPAYVELRLSPEEMGLVSNGKYRFDFEFLFDADDQPTKDNTFSFTFYADYAAPVLQDARLRYYNYKEGNKDKQKIYLDLDVFDNVYAQSVMLCYRDEKDGEVTLNLVNEYAEPVRNPNKNGVTTVTIEVTDIWDEYKNNLYVQIDDYALNHSSYYLGVMNGAANDVTTALNKSVLPDEFDLAPGEENITIDIYEAHKIGLVYEGNADISNFIMTVGSQGITNNGYFAVKNGEVVGLKSTNGRPLPLTISNGKGGINGSKTVKVTVTDTVRTVSNPDFGFNVIRSSTDSLIKSGAVTVNAGEDIKLKILPDPWYYPMDGVQINWTSSGSAVTVSDKGVVHTVSKGLSTVSATFTVGGIRYTKNLIFTVNDPFTISNMALTHYHGDGVTIYDDQGNVVEENVVIIPEGKNIMSIGEEAFKNNKVIKKVIIPKTVTQIGRRAFYGCTALEGVYFIDDKKVDYDDDNFVADSDLTLIDREAFEGCTSLKILDLSNVKVITVAREAFKDCEALEEVVKSTAIGTAHDRAFLGCKALKKIDLSELHSAGANVFSGCENLSEVITNGYSVIGARMFSDLKYEYQVYDYSTSSWTLKKVDYPACTNLKTVEIKTPTVGVGAFENCTSLTSVKFANGDKGTNFEFVIGANAFAGCSELSSVNFGECNVRSIGTGAFANTKLTSLTLPNGLQTIGAGAFDGTSLTLSGGSSYNITNGADYTVVLSGDNKTLLMFTGTGSYTVPSTVEKISAYAFANSQVTSVTIPSSVKEIGEGAFADSTLSSVTISANISAVPAYAFSNTKLTSLTIPASVTYVDDYAFAGNTELVTFNYAPEGAAQFGSCTFLGCTALTQIALNANITKLGDRTFQGCTALQTVSLPSLVNVYGSDGSETFTALGEYTFWNTPRLATVTFGVNSNTTGNYTFAANSAAGRTALTSVEIGNAVKKIGDHAFYNCASLASIDLKNATETGAFAFTGCTALNTVTGLNKLVTIGDYSFADCVALGSLELTSAKTIGEGAFAINSGTRAYTSISIPNAETIGAFAFLGGRETTVEIPVSVKSIGDGAFAMSSRLTSFTFAGDNDKDKEKYHFFTEDGVLYERVKNVVNGQSVNTGDCILVAFPTAKTVAATNGEKVYTLNENTVKVGGSAFRGLAGGIDKVVLPYGLKVVGVAAFYDSGITKYEFKGATAPVLEMEYSAVIDRIMDGDTSYRGYYYANFEGDFIFYAGHATGTTPASLTIYRPDNGTGYDNYVFSNYFGDCVLTGITMSEATNSFIELVGGFYSAQEISEWNPDNPASPTKAEVEAFAESVKRAHEYYNAFSSDATQLAFVDSSLIEKFNSIETALRQVKIAYDIPFTIARLSYTGDFKSVYKVGEYFDITGLQVIIIYNDYSTEYADMSKVTYDLHDPLTRLDNVVKLTYEGRTVRVGITVSEENENPGENGEGGCGGGCGSTSTLTGTMLLTFTALGLMVVLTTFVRKKNRGIR